MDQILPGVPQGGRFFQHLLLHFIPLFSKKADQRHSQERNHRNDDRGLEVAVIFRIRNQKHSGQRSCKRAAHRAHGHKAGALLYARGHSGRQSENRRVAERIAGIPQQVGHHSQHNFDRWAHASIEAKQRDRAQWDQNGGEAKPG